MLRELDADKITPRGMQGTVSEEDVGGISAADELRRNLRSAPSTSSVRGKVANLRPTLRLRSGCDDEQCMRLRGIQGQVIHRGLLQARVALGNAHVVHPNIELIRRHPEFHRQPVESENARLILDAIAIWLVDAEPLVRDKDDGAHAHEVQHLRRRVHEAEVPGVAQFLVGLKGPAGSQACVREQGHGVRESLPRGQVKLGPLPTVHILHAQLVQSQLRALKQGVHMLACRKLADVAKGTDDGEDEGRDRHAHARQRHIPFGHLIDRPEVDRPQADIVHRVQSAGEGRGTADPRHE
mmetsp:Transcript_10186/g.30066  ORF Transcript_10186/g.30066 Transcript_10186/m.30066 type:complete len:296 (+) Transcript_10186:1436-2323(+)